MKTKATTEAKPSEGAPTRQSIGVDLVDRKVRNHRATIDPDRLAELGTSMEQVGLMSPIGVCAKNGRYVLIFGHRRLQAAKQLGWKRITAEVYGGLTRPQIAEMQAIENLQREDLNPIEEAHAVKALINAGQDVDKVASRIDRGLDFVRSRLDLLRLGVPIQEFVASGRLPLKHARLIARVGDASKQTSAVQAAFGVQYGVTLSDAAKTDYLMPLAKLRDQISYLLRTLGNKGWPMDEAYAGKRACQGCPDNSVTEPGLFEGIKLPGKSPKGNCSNRACFERKSTAWDKDPVKLARVKAREAKTKTAEKKAPPQTAAAKETSALNRRRRRFPSTAEEQHAVALWTYAVKLGGAIRKRLEATSKPADLEGCLWRLYTLKYPHVYNVGTGFSPGRCDRLREAFSKKAPIRLDKVDAAKLFKIWAVDAMGCWKPAFPTWTDKPVHVPVARDGGRIVAILEALGRHWGVVFDCTQPKLKDFQDAKAKPTKRAKASAGKPPKKGRG